VWRELRLDVEASLASIRRALHESEKRRTELLAHAPDDEPDLWDLRAAAGLLEECYTGIENSFKLIATRLDGGLPSRSDRWHVDLLESMSVATERRPAVLSAETRDRTRDYLGFRHVARSHYGHELHWPRMRPLVEGLPVWVAAIEQDLLAFLASGEGQ